MCAANPFPLCLWGTTVIKTNTSFRAPPSKKIIEPLQHSGPDCWVPLQLLQQVPLYCQLPDFQTPHLWPLCCFTVQCWLLALHPRGFPVSLWFKIILPVSCLTCLLSELLSLLPEELFVVLPSQGVNIPFIRFQSAHGKMQMNRNSAAIPKFVQHLSLYMHVLSAVSTCSSDVRASLYCQSKEKLRLTISRELSENWNLLVFGSYSHSMTSHFRNTLPGIRKNDCSMWKQIWGNLKIAVPGTIPWGSTIITASLSTV